MPVIGGVTPKEGREAPADPFDLPLKASECNPLADLEGQWPSQARAIPAIVAFRLVICKAFVYCLGQCEVYGDVFLADSPRGDYAANGCASTGGGTLKLRHNMLK